MKKWPAILVILGLLALLAACGPSVDYDDEVSQRVAETQTKQAWEASVEAAQLTAEADSEQSEDTEEVQDPPPPTQTPQPEDTPLPEIIHVIQPDLPAEKINSFVTDFNSSGYAFDGFTYGDQFFINRYERPFTREMTEYRGYLDIVEANLKYNPPWLYIEVFLAKDLPESSSAVYGIELDLDKDARGDYLVLVPHPVSEEWSVEGVAVVQDTNDDVGGEIPLLTEVLPDDWNGDGYDRVLFQSGQGGDPDLAWVRRDPELKNSLQIAFKSDLVGTTGFFWVVWADEGLQNPALADYNDQFTFEEAGSPYPEHRYHPIQEINLVDSTCRSWYMFEPVGDEVGVCQIYEPGEGFQLCYTFNTGATPITACNEVCSPECPDLLPGNAFCRPCTIP